MKYFWYAFLGLFSLGFLAGIAGIIFVIAVISHYGNQLPDYNQLEEYKPPIVTRVYAGDGRLMAEFAQEKRVFVPIQNIPDIVKQAFISAEDQNFYNHEGVDLMAIARAALTNAKNIGRGRRPEGASTITQQVAKNFLLTNEVSYERKIKEAILAYRMERVFTKDRLLELYLNEIYLGSRAYGVAAAALQYFDKSLDEMTIAETAYLAALPKAPNNYHPVRDHDAAKARRNWVIDRMAEEGYIEQAQADLAKLAPLKVTPRDENNVVNAPYFQEEVRRELAQRYGEDSLYGGGLVVRTTINPRLQEVAVQTLRKGLMEYDKRWGWRGPLTTLTSTENWQAELENVTPPEGLLRIWSLAVVLDVKADKATIGLPDGQQSHIRLQDTKWARKQLKDMYTRGPVVESLGQVVSAGDVIMVEAVYPENAEEEQALEDQASEPQPDHYKLQQIPLAQGALIAMDPHTGRVLAMQGGWQHDTSEFNRVTQAKRQPGSAFKPFVYLAALEHGFTPATLVLDAPFVIEDRPGNFWSPTNYSNEYYGPTPIRVGVEKSKNLMTVRLADYLGMDVVTEVAARFGIVSNMPPLLANSLGAGEATLIDITSAYGTLVNGGKKITPTIIDRIQDRRGKTIFKHDARQCENCGQLVKWLAQEVPNVPDTRPQLTSPQVAYQMTSILEGVIQRGTAVKIKDLGIPLAGKTGTTNESKDTWFIGYSPDLAVGVFVGFDEPRSMGKRETGSSVAVPIFKDFMEEAIGNKPPVPFRVPPGIRHVQINAETGIRAQPGDENVIWEAFIEGTEPSDKMYILDGRGISLMPVVESSEGSVGRAANTGTGGLY